MATQASITINSFFILFRTINRLIQKNNGSFKNKLFAKLRVLPLSNYMSLSVVRLYGFVSPFFDFNVMIFCNAIVSRPIINRKFKFG